MFLDGADLAAVLPLLGIAVVLAVVRAACLLLQEVVAQRASSGLRAALRAALTGAPPGARARSTPAASGAASWSRP